MGRRPSSPPRPAPPLPAPPRPAPPRSPLPRAALPPGGTGRRTRAGHPLSSPPPWRARGPRGEAGSLRRGRAGGRGRRAERARGAGTPAGESGFPSGCFG
ncbi:hypothetical protein VULLAG_LOCUS6477 [Vulpes lagopus]